MPRSFVLQLFRGAGYPLRAFYFLGKHGLWPLALWAVAVNVVLLVAAVVAAVRFALPFIVQLVNGAVHAAPTLLGGERLFLGPFAEALVAYSIWGLFLPLMVFAGAGLVLLFGQVLASPVLDRLSERCEAIALGTVAPPWRLRQSVDASLMAVTDATWGFVTQLWTLGPRLAMALVPGVGALVLWSVAAGFVAHDFIGLPMTRQLVPYGARWRAVMRHPGLAIGFGGSAYALLLVPGLNLLLLPLACAGGTLLYCDMVRAELLDVPGLKPGTRMTPG